jgi:hypothetical protein
LNSTYNACICVKIVVLVVFPKLRSLNKNKIEGLINIKNGGMLLTIVPLTWVETWPFSLSDTSLERPKSATFAVKLSSSKILVDFTSLWIMGGLANSCKYASPLAEPRAIRSLLFQSSWYPDFPAIHIDWCRRFY